MRNISIYLFSVILALGAWSCAEEVGDNTVFGEAITKYELIGPKSNDTITINTGALDEIMVFTWQKAESGLGNPIKYTLLFYKDGDVTQTPIWSKLSDESGALNQATITFAELKAVYEAGKNATEDIARLVWSVKTENGSPNVKLAQVSSLIKLKTTDDGLSSFLLTAPVDNSLLPINGIFAGEKIAFEWDASVSTEGSAVTYKLLVDALNGDFSSPLISIDSDNGGAATKVEKTISQWNTLFEQYKLSNGNYKWTVVANATGITWMKDVNTMYLESSNWTNPIYIVGDATSVLWDLDKALNVRFISANLWATVIPLTDAKEFKFLRTKGSLENQITAEMFTDFVNCELLANGNIKVATGTSGTFVIVVDLSAKMISVFEFPHLVGGSTIVDWNTGNAYPLSRVSKGLFETYEYVTVDGYGFKFLPTKDWKGDFGKSKTTAGLLAQNDEDNISVEANGFYRIRADYNTMTYRVDEVTWGIYGTATSGGATTSTPMEFANPAKGQYTWSVDADLIIGTLKFRANNTNTINMGDTGNNGSLEYGGTAIPVAAAGNYRITLTLNTKLGYSYSITAN